MYSSDGVARRGGGFAAERVKFGMPVTVTAAAAAALDRRLTFTAAPSCARRVPVVTAPRQRATPNRVAEKPRGAPGFLGNVKKAQGGA